jgi:hypothetical protein
MTVMTVSPDDFTHKIDVLQLSTAATAGGMLALVLAEQMCRINCGTVSARWQIPAGDVPTPRKPADELADHGWVATDPEGLGGHDPGA